MASPLDDAGPGGGGGGGKVGNLTSHAKTVSALFRQHSMTPRGDDYDDDSMSVSSDGPNDNAKEMSKLKLSFLHQGRGRGNIGTNTAAAESYGTERTKIPVATLVTPTPSVYGEEAAAPRDDANGHKFVCGVCKIVSFCTPEETRSHEMMCLAVQQRFHSRAAAAEREAAEREAALVREAAIHQEAALAMDRALMREAAKLAQFRQLELATHMTDTQLVYQRALAAAGQGPPPLQPSPHALAPMLQPQVILVPQITPSGANVHGAYPLQTLSQAQMGAYPIYQPSSVATPGALQGLAAAGIGPTIAGATGGVGPPPVPTTGIGLHPIPAPSNADALKGHEPQPPPAPDRQHPKRLALPEDANYLNERECFLRSQCLELFEATQEDTVAARNGRRQPVRVGQVGMRCAFCSSAKAFSKPSPDGKGKIVANRGFCYPSSIKFIRKGIDNWRENHFSSCPNIPEVVKKKYASLGRMGSSSAEGYRIDAAMKLGLVNCPKGGIRFCR